MQHYRAPEIEAGSGPGDIAGASIAEVFAEQRVDVPGENAARRQFLAVSRFREKRLALQALAGALDRLFERQVLEGVQRVVVNEDADRALRGQQARVSGGWSSMRR